MKLFLDSGPLIAKFNQKDPYYDSTKVIFDQIQSKELDVTRILTSNLVIGEVLTHILYATHNLEYCRKILNLVGHSKYLEIVYIDQNLDNSTRAYFLKYFDQELSFVDCSNSIIMQEYNIDSIFTFDGSFQKLGFVCLP